VLQQTHITFRLVFQILQFSRAYQASKTAAAMFSDHQRIELALFGVCVVDLKAGAAKFNFQSALESVSTAKRLDLPTHEGRTCDPRRALLRMHGFGRLGGAGGLRAVEGESVGAGVAR
jgi:NAD(P)-dependent dehydrogenase (short-subunit alcohol dehydrogenase family)